MSWALHAKQREIIGVTAEAYFAAVEMGEDLKLEVNDAPAVDIMKTNNVKEIYSFDEHFDQVDAITKLPTRKNKD